MQSVSQDYRKANLEGPTRALLDFAAKLTREGDVERVDVDGLIALGWTERAIHDATQVVAYFNYINRIASGLGADPEPDWKV